MRVCAVRVRVCGVRRATCMRLSGEQSAKRSGETVGVLQRAAIAAEAQQSEFESCLDAPFRFSVAVNVFARHLDKEDYDGRDPYGARRPDALFALPECCDCGLARARTFLSCFKEVTLSSFLMRGGLFCFWAGNRDLPAGGRAAGALKSMLGPLPEPYRSFYVRRAAAELL